VPLARVLDPPCRQTAMRIALRQTPEAVDTARVGEDENRLHRGGGGAAAIVTGVPAQRREHGSQFDLRIQVDVPVDEDAPLFRAVGLQF
jgi:hypothetical protein